jgi:hypothetical protein
MEEGPAVFGNMTVCDQRQKKDAGAEFFERIGESALLMTIG